MERISSIEKLLSGIKIINLSKGTDMQKMVCPELRDGNIDTNSLLFLTEKANGENENFDAAPLQISPYAIVANKNTRVLNCKSKLIRVENVRKAFAYACSNLYDIDYSKVKIISVTGTNGKTTTATLIYKILRSSGYRTGFIGTGKILINDEILTNENYSMTTPDPTLLYDTIFKMVISGTEYIVMEVSSHSIALQKVAPIKFEYGIFTNLSEEHLDFHSNINEYYKTKLGLFSSVKHGLFNMDDRYSRLAYQSVKCSKSSIGIVYNGDAYASDIEAKGDDGSSFFYREKNLIFKVNTQLCGPFNIYNCLMALKCVIDLGIKPCIAKEAISKIKSIEGRMQIIKSDITVIIDYAHTPAALYNCLKTAIAIKKPKQNLNIVFGCGGNRDRSKRKSMGEIASDLADRITLTEDNNRNEDFTDIISDIARGITNKEFNVIEDREIAIRTAINNAKGGDIVAIIGKGHEKYMISKGDILPFNEMKIIEKALMERADNYAN